MHMLAYKVHTTGKHISAYYCMCLSAYYCIYLHICCIFSFAYYGISLHFVMKSVHYENHYEIWHYVPKLCLACPKKHPCCADSPLAVQWHSNTEEVCPCSPCAQAAVASCSFQGHISAWKHVDSNDLGIQVSSWIFKRFSGKKSTKLTLCRQCSW